MIKKLIPLFFLFTTCKDREVKQEIALDTARAWLQLPRDEWILTRDTVLYSADCLDSMVIKHDELGRLHITAVSHAGQEFFKKLHK